MFQARDPQFRRSAGTLAGRLGEIVRTNRRQRRWSQRHLAQQALVSQSAVSRAERAVASRVHLQDVQRMLDALGARVAIVSSGIVDISFPAQHDQLHARLVGYVAGRLAAVGFAVRREVPVGGDRVHGWIDLLAWDPRRRVVLVVEAKSSIRDLGALERQIGWYGQSALPAARTLGWQARQVGVLVAALASAENVAFIRSNVVALRARFPSPPALLQCTLDDAAEPWPPQAECIALIDPARRGRFLLPTPLARGGLVVPYVDASDALERWSRRRTGPGPRQIEPPGRRRLGGPTHA